MRPTLVRRLATPLSNPQPASLKRVPATNASTTSKPSSPTPTSATPTSPPTSHNRKISSPLESKLRSSTRPKLTNRTPPLSLEHFLLRSRVLTLYRTILRAIYQIPDPDARRDPIAHAKGEFARNRGVTDTAQIRYLASTGKAEWDGMRRYVEELAMRAGEKGGKGKKRP